MIASFAINAQWRLSLTLCIRRSPYSFGGWLHCQWRFFNFFCRLLFCCIRARITFLWWFCFICKSREGGLAPFFKCKCYFCIEEIIFLILTYLEKFSVSQQQLSQNVKLLKERNKKFPFDQAYIRTLKYIWKMFILRRLIIVLN